MKAGNKSAKNNLDIVKIDKDKEQLDKYLEDIKDIDSYKDMPEFRSNPFVCLLPDKIVMKWNTKGTVNDIGAVQFSDPDTGEVVDATMNRVIRKKEYVDKEQFAKIYFSQMKQLFSLSHSALKVWMYLVQEQSNSADSSEVYLRRYECMEVCNWTQRNMLYIALKELIVKGFICKSDIQWKYFINPLFSFNGNRLIVFNEYIKRDYFEKDSIKELE